jgi:hypothetical protein
LYLNIYLRRIMADEYERLLEVLDVPPGEEGAEAAEATGADHDESLLDVDDEVCILDPPLLPTPAEPPTVSTANENDKVNAEIMDLDDISETHSSQNTQSSFLTTYSKYGIREGFRYTEGEYDPDSDRPPMSSAYYQCKAARAASFSHTCTNVESGPNSGSEKTVSFSSISSLNCTGDTEVLKTFRGTRMQNNHGTENQNISFSFDPATLQCISCEIEHSILKTGEGGAPPIIVLSDQNFIPTLCGGGELRCYCKVRRRIAR